MDGGSWVLMEPILSLHYVAEIPLSLRYTPLKRSILLLRSRSGLVPLAPVGLYLGLVHARPKRKISVEIGQCTSVFEDQ